MGPGDPELLTLRAIRALEEADCVAAPDVGGSSRTALRVVESYIKGKTVIDCATPMSRDGARRDAAYDAIADKLAGALDAGATVAFVTLGDASVYSTWPYVARRMEGRGYDIEVIPGVTSFCAAAALLREPLCEGDEQLLISPVAAGDACAALDVPATKVFMKSGKRLGELIGVLEERGLAGRASLVSRCGLEGEAVVRGLDSSCDSLGYLSVVIVKERPEDPGA